MRTKVFTIVYVIAGFLSLWILSCKHEPMFLDDDMLPIDTMTTTIDTMMVDTTMVDTSMIDTTINMVPCDPNLIYFQTDILPLLNSNCAFSGCHDVASAEDGVILDSYENVMATADVEPFNLDDSEIYEVLVHTDIDERMPPAPTAALSQNQIQQIAEWILQGAKNLECDPDLEPCDTEDVSFSLDIKPIIDLKCVGCHSGGQAAAGINLSLYPGVKSVADNGSLLGSILWENQYVNMPRNGDRLPTCEIDRIKSWIDAGALDN